MGRRGDDLAHRLAGQINRGRGKDGPPALLIAGETVLDSDVRDWLSTQCPTLDMMIGRPGIPTGRLTTLGGKESTGKSTLVCHLLAETQRRGGLAVLGDTERRYDREWGAKIGIDHSKLLVLSSRSAEDMFSEIKEVSRQVRALDPQTPVTIAWDSLSATPTKGELEGKGQIGDHARLVSKEMRQSHLLIAHQRIALVIVVQPREKVDFGSSAYFGGDTTTWLAARALRHHSSLVLLFTNTSTKKGAEEDPFRYSEVTVKLDKCTISGNEKRSCTFVIDKKAGGIDRTEAALTVALKIGAVKRDGAWYSYDGLDKKFRGKDFDVILSGYPELQERIHNAPVEWQA